MRDLVEPRVRRASRRRASRTLEDAPARRAAGHHAHEGARAEPLCLGTTSYPQSHDDRYVSYILNTVLGGSMSSRLFQNVREKRGLAYAVFSGLSAYRDAGQHHHLRRLRKRSGRAKSSSLCVEELRQMKQTPVPDAELRRAKDHLKGSLMLSLENTASRMSHLARQEIYFDRHFGLDETLTGVERVTDRRRAARRARPLRQRIAGRNGARPEHSRSAEGEAGSWVSDSGSGSGLGSCESAKAAVKSRSDSPTSVGRDSRIPDADPDPDMIPRYTNPEMGAHLERAAPLRDLARRRARGHGRDGRSRTRAGGCRARAARKGGVRHRAGSRRSSRSRSTTSSPSRPPSPSTSDPPRAGSTSASPPPTSSTPRRPSRCARPAT